MNKPVIIICATDLGKAVFETFKSNEVLVYGFLDDDKKLHDKQIGDTTVLGDVDDEEYLNVIGEDCDVFIASDDNAWKANIIKNLRKNQKTMPVNAVHDSATIASSTVLHHGTFINQGVNIGSYSEIGNHCILHSGSIIDYGVKIGDFVQIGSGSIINSGALIGDGVFIGSGVTIISGITIGKGARIGVGSVVIANVKQNETVFGNPAKSIK